VENVEFVRQEGNIQEEYGLYYGSYVCVTYAFFQVVRPFLAPHCLVRRGWCHRRRLFWSTSVEAIPWNTGSSLLSGKSALDRSRHPVCIVLDAVYGVAWLVDWEAHVTVVWCVSILVFKTGLPYSRVRFI
jgi:hypothetical protein